MCAVLRTGTIVEEAESYEEAEGMGKSYTDYTVEAESKSYTEEAEGKRQTCQEATDETGN